MDAWVPGAELLADMSWGLVERTVLHLATDQGEVTVKASPPQDRHTAREIAAHRAWLAPLVAEGHVPRLLHADQAARILGAEHLPGELVLGHPAQSEPETFAQAGRILRLLHGQARGVDAGYGQQLRETTLRWLSRPHRIEPSTARELHRRVSAWPDQGAEMVPTHQDFQPRNWLVDEARVRLIDFGGMELAPALVALVRLHRQDFQDDPRLEQAFLAGYGSDPRRDELWPRQLLAQAVSTAVWAFGVGDEAFEQQGHRMVAQCLDGVF